MRSQFTFYKSFDDVYQDLTKEQKIEFIDIILDVQFLRKKIDDVKFKDPILKHIWNAQKYQLEKSIKGYLDSQKSEKVLEPFLGCYDDNEIKLLPYEGGHQQGQVQGQVQGQEEEGSNAPLRSATLSDFEIDEAFNTIWTIHSERLKEIKTKDGNPRKNNDKTKTKQRFISLLKKYNNKAIFCYVRNSTLSFSPKCLYNLFGKDIDEPLLKILNIQDVEILDEALNSSDSDFLAFVEEIEEQI